MIILDKRYVNKEILRICIKTNIRKVYNTQCEVTEDGFNTGKVGRACRKNISYHGFLWFYKEEFTENLIEIKMKSITSPKRKKPKLLNHKVCKICFIDKNLTEFHKEKLGKFGVRHECKRCQHTRINNRKKIDINYRLKQNLRKRLNAALKVKTWHKNSKFNEYIGCNLFKLRHHLELQFNHGMSWDNYGKWEIDHIIPLSLAKTEQELYKLSHYMNLQPLWKIDNIKKGGKYQAPKF